jgi:hypothetical protein
MRDNEPIVSINGYERVIQLNNRRETEKVVDGVAIYQNLQSATTCLPVSNHIRCTNDTIGDVCTVKVIVDSRMKFFLGTAHVHPDTSQRDTRLFLSQFLAPCVFIQAHHSEILTSSSLSLFLAPCMFIQAHHSEILASSSLSSFLAPCVFIQAHHSEILASSSLSSILASCGLIQARHRVMVTSSSINLWYHVGPSTLPNLQSYIETPILLCGDFSFDSAQNKTLLEFIFFLF